MATHTVDGEDLVIHKHPGRYVGPEHTLLLLPDGRLAAGVRSAPWADHAGPGEWVVRVSADGGRTWTEDADPAMPLNWPGSATRERADRLSVVLADGTWVAAGAVSWEEWPASRRDEATAEHRRIRPHPGGDHLITVGSQRLYAQRSTDRGKTWYRQEWTVPECGVLIGFPRGLVLSDGTLLYPVREQDDDQFRRQGHAWRSTDGGRSWALRPFPSGVLQRTGNEAAFIETAPGRVLCLMRDYDSRNGGSGYLLELWSDDAGASWSRPVRTPMWGFPPHLLRLSDGRILCSYSYRRVPMGIRACLSEDDGLTWRVEDELILRDDGGTPSELRPDRGVPAGDLGYPITHQLSDGTLFTAYWFTGADRVTYLAGTRWSI